MSRLLLFDKTTEQAYCTFKETTFEKTKLDLFILDFRINIYARHMPTELHIFSKKIFIKKYKCDYIWF